MRNLKKEYAYWIPRMDNLYHREIVQCSACHHTQLNPTETCEHCHTSMMRCAEKACCMSFPHCDGCRAKLPAVEEPEFWVIPVTWEMCGTIAIPKTKAPCLEDAIRLCNEDSDSLALPNGEYVDGSFSVTGEERGYIRQFYNNGTHDAKSEGFYSVSVEGHLYYLHIQESDPGWKYIVYHGATVLHSGTFFACNMDEDGSTLESVRLGILQYHGLIEDGLTYTIKDADHAFLTQLQEACNATRGAVK